MFEAVKSQISSLKKDLEAVKTKYNEVSEKLMEKSRQYQKLQVNVAFLTQYCSAIGIEIERRRCMNAWKLRMRRDIIQLCPMM